MKKQEQSQALSQTQLSRGGSKMKNKSRILFAVFLAVMLVASLLTGVCAKAAPASGPIATPKPTPKPPQAPAAHKPYGTLIVQATTFQNWAMNPCITGGAQILYLDALYDSLTRIQYNESAKAYKLVPGLATKWESTPDFKTWTFWLRKGVQWHEGYGEFTGEDIKYTVEQVIKNPKLPPISSPQEAVKSLVETVEVPDPYKVIFHLSKPYGTLDNLFSDLWETRPVCKRYIEKVGWDEANKKPVGTGPFKFVDMKMGEYIKVEALEKHWRQVPYYKTIIFKEVKESATAIAMLKSGDADVISVPLELRDQIVLSGFEARINRETEYTFAAFSGLWDPKLPETDQKVPWRDVKVREAMNIAIDRNTIARVLYKGEAQPAPVVLFMPGTAGYNPNLKPYPYDPKRAKQLLAEAGYPNGFQLNMLIYPWTHAPEIPELGQVLAQYWSAIGIQARISWSEFTTMRKLYSSRKDPWMVSPIGYTRMPAPEVHLETFFRPEGGLLSLDTPNIWNLVKEFETEADPVRRDTIGQKIGEEIYKGYWFVPVAWSVMPYYVNKKKIGHWDFLKGLPFHYRLETLRHPRE